MDGGDRLGKEFGDAAQVKRSRIYSNERSDIGAPSVASLPPDLKALLDRRNQANGLDLLARLPAEAASLVFFDPEYRGVLDCQGFGNKGERQRQRAALDQMSEVEIRNFIAQIERVLAPRGHLMLWVGGYRVVEGVIPWLEGLALKALDMIAWDKGENGMGYGTRSKCEYLLVVQKLPLRAKVVLNIPDVWLERLEKSETDAHAHSKPVRLQSRVIAATTPPGGLVIDPAAGSFSVMRAAHAVERPFLGCDLRG